MYIDVYQSHTTCSLWSFIVWQLVSTSIIGHYQTSYVRTLMETETTYLEVGDVLPDDRSPTSRNLVALYTNDLV